MVKSFTLNFPAGLWHGWVVSVDAVANMRPLIMKIMKSVFAVLLIATAITNPAVAADPAPSIAVIDTGTNTSLWGDKISYEVCFVAYFYCPNGKTSMEGTGAANLPKTTDEKLDHGTQMISVITAVNPTVKVIPIRIVGMNAKGLASLYSLSDVQKGLDWVVANQAKFNIVAVNIAQGAIFADCKVPSGMASQIAKLKAINVPVLVATGNLSNRKSVNAPACLADTVSVGATDNPWTGAQPKNAPLITYNKNAKPYIARYSNGATGQVDFYLNGRYQVTNLNGSTKFMVGTSNATAALSGWWVLNKQATFDDTFKYIMDSTIEATNEWVTGRYVPLP